MIKFDIFDLLDFFQKIDMKQSFNYFFELVFDLFKKSFNTDSGFIIIYDHARDILRLYNTENVDEKECNRIFEHYKSIISETELITKKSSNIKLIEETYNLSGKNFISIPFYGSESLIFLISLEVESENVINELKEKEISEVYYRIKEKIEFQYEDIYEYKITQIKNKEMSALFRVGKIMTGTLELTTLMDKIIDIMRDVLDSEAASVFMYDEDTNELYFYIAQGEKAESVKEIRLPIGTGIAGWCAENKLPVFVPDTSKDPRFYKQADDKSKFETRSLVAVPMVNNDKLVGVLEVLNKKGEIPYNKHDVELLEAIASLAVNAFENASLYSNLNNLYLSTIKVLSAALDAKDQYTQGHSERVAMYSVLIAKKLGFSKSKLEEINFAGLLHDFGKIGIRDLILCKPGKLTDEEYSIIKTHPVKSAEILKGIDFFKGIIPMIRFHHERWDGRGYPDGLKELEIPLEARIIAVADTFDAMTSHRSYRKGLPVEIAISEIKKCSGTQFDPVVAATFIKVFEEELEEKFEEIRGEFIEQDIVKDN